MWCSKTCSSLHAKPQVPTLSWKKNYAQFKAARKPAPLRKTGGKLSQWQQKPKEHEAALGSWRRSDASGSLRQISVNERKATGGGGKWQEIVRVQWVLQELTGYLVLEGCGTGAMGTAQSTHSEHSCGGRNSPCCKLRRWLGGVRELEPSTHPTEDILGGWSLRISAKLIAGFHWTGWADLLLPPIVVFLSLLWDRGAQLSKAQRTHPASCGCISCGIICWNCHADTTAKTRERARAEKRKSRICTLAADCT